MPTYLRRKPPMPGLEHEPLRRSFPDPEDGAPGPHDTKKASGTEEGSGTGRPTPCLFAKPQAHLLRNPSPRSGQTQCALKSLLTSEPRGDRSEPKEQLSGYKLRRSQITEKFPLSGTPLAHFEQEREAEYLANLLNTPRIAALDHKTKRYLHHTYRLLRPMFSRPASNPRLATEPAPITTTVTNTSHLNETYHLAAYSAVFLAHHPNHLNRIASSLRQAEKALATLAVRAISPAVSELRFLQISSRTQGHIDEFWQSMYRGLRNQPSLLRHLVRGDAMTILFGRAISHLSAEEALLFSGSFTELSGSLRAAELLRQALPNRMPHALVGLGDEVQKFMIERLGLGLARDLAAALPPSLRPIIPNLESQGHHDELEALLEFSNNLLERKISYLARSAPSYRAGNIEPEHPTARLYAFRIQRTFT